MDDIRERVRGFLAEFTSPNEKDIQDFIADIASKNPSLDIESFKKKLSKVIGQGEEIRNCENALSFLSPDLPIYGELKKILNEAKEGHGNLEDISGELKTAKELLASVKGEAEPVRQENAEGAGPVTSQQVAQQAVGGDLKLEELPEEEEETAEAERSEKAREPEGTGVSEEKAGQLQGEEKVKQGTVPETKTEDAGGKAGAKEAPEPGKSGTEKGTEQAGKEALKQPQEKEIAQVNKTEEPAHQKEAVTGKGTPEKPVGEKTIVVEQEEPIEKAPKPHETEKTPAMPTQETGIKKEAEAGEKGPKPPEKEGIPVKEAAEPAEKVEAEKKVSEPSGKKEIPDVGIDISDEPAGTEDEIYPTEEPVNTEAKSPEEDRWKSLDIAEDLLHRLDLDDTRDILKDQFTPEKQAVFELLEEKLLTDVETRIKKLKEVQSKVLEEKPPQTFFGKIKTFFTMESESVEAYDVAIHGPLVTFEGLEGMNEVERYWVNEPYAFVVILFDPENNTYLYYAAEPVLTEFEDLFLKEIKDRLKDVLLVENIKSEEDKDKILTGKVRALVKDYAIDITPLTLEKIMYYTRRDFIKFGKIDPLMHDNRIEDVSANGHDIPIYLYHKKYTNIPTNIYYNENELNSYVIRLAQRCGKHISIAEPMVDATMPDGSRIQMTLGTEVTSRGATFTIRKFSEIPITPVDLINWNTFSAEEMAYLWLCIENNKSLIYAGGTASGKTSSLNAVSLFIPAQAKIVTLEDTRELKLPHPNWIPGVTRDSFTADGRGGIDMYELLRAALRQRPEFLLVGEVRGKEALTLFQAMSTGHTTFSTMHADSVASAIHRLENPPISVPRTMIQALNIISIQSQTYVKGKRARRNMKLVEITDIDPTTRNIRTNDIFVWDPLTDKFIRTGESKALNEIMIRRGWSLPDLKKELMNRQKILEFMVNNKITDFNAISTIIHDYQATPEKVLTKLNING